MNSSKLLLLKEYKRFIKNPSDYFSISVNENNIYIWNIYFTGPPDTLYKEGYFKARMEFPKEYPLKPPTFMFLNEMFHPNIYKDGKVCISILHEPIKDQYDYEHINERWNPTQSVETIVLSIISLLSSPNFESPANIDSSMLYKNNFKEYKRKVRKLARNTIV